MSRRVAPVAGTFAYIEEKIRAECPGTKFGSAFEWLCKYFLQNGPKYAGVFEKIWRWNEWPDRWGIDKGIDLVARTKDGKLWAIQAKAVSPDRSIPKSELDSFLSESNRPQFDYRLIIATTDDIGRNARDTIKGQEKPVGLVLRGHYRRGTFAGFLFLGPVQAAGEAGETVIVHQERLRGLEIVEDIAGWITKQ